jgi:hypothetical protein
MKRYLLFDIFDSNYYAYDQDGDSRWTDQPNEAKRFDEYGEAERKAKAIVEKDFRYAIEIKTVFF